MSKITALSLLLLTLLCSHCDQPTTDASAVAAKAITQPAETKSEIPRVALHLATTGRLPLRRRATGKLRARRQIVVKSRSGGDVITAPTEGTYYQKGDLLLATDPQPLALSRDRAAAARNEAAFRQRDLLLRLSTNLPAADSTAITDLARANILQQSGLPAAEVALAEAEYQLSLAQITAPFAGRVADVMVQTGSRIGPGEDICSLIDLASLEVEFALLEQELARSQVQSKVFVSPVAQPDLRLPAVLDILNPTVDAGGLLRARARLTNYDNALLYPGMNVTVTLENNSPPVVLLPKSAIVTRSGKALVFTHDSDSELAKWQYVTVGYENDELVGITEGVQAGQAVIVAGNLTLDHDARVRIAE
jgi:RND family efflux transporter MFP subunit